MWTPAKKSFQREREALEKYIAERVPAEQRVGTIEPWDWRFYAEKVRQSSYDLDDSEVKPYFPLTNMVQGIFDTASQLFGLRFKERPDIVSYHPDVKTYEVHETDADGKDKLVAIFLHDNYARPHKRSGAWMSHYRPQSPGVVPIVCNNNNFNKGSEASPSLLAFDDAVTLFHEFGHGLHGMLSNVNYKRLAGTNVLKDFVELPSQLYEHWLSQPEVLKKHARHYQTGEPIPDALLKRLMAARSFNQGFQTIEYTACALVDTAVHRVTDLENFSMAEFEKAELARLEMPSGIVMRHRPAHFLRKQDIYTALTLYCTYIINYISYVNSSFVMICCVYISVFVDLFAGSSYAAGYYVYLWAEVLDADGFDAFLEAGGPFHADTAARVRKFVYSSGNSLDPAEAFRKFRGRCV